VIDVGWDNRSASRHFTSNKLWGDFFRDCSAKRISLMLMREMIASESMI
jgi:hypothetical protein